MIMTTIIAALVLVFIWCIILMFDIKGLEAKHEQMISDIWDTMACKANQLDVEVMIDKRDYQNMEEHTNIKFDIKKNKLSFDKAMLNLNNLAKQLGYEWCEVDAMNEYLYDAKSGWYKIETKEDTVPCSKKPKVNTKPKPKTKK